jgi:hypothetical protein
MKITTTIDNDRQRIEILVSGTITAENTFGIIQYAIVESLSNNYRELTLDLRGARFDHATSMFRLHTLLQFFKSVILQKELQVTILFKKDSTEQWMQFGKAAECAGINMRSFINRQAGSHFPGQDFATASPVVH